MQIEINNDYQITYIIPDDGCLLYNIKANTYHEKVYLGKFDDVSNYKDIQKSLIENTKEKENKELYDVINKQDELIKKMAEQLEIYAKLTFPNDNA